MTSLSVNAPGRIVGIKFLEAFGFTLCHLVAALAFLPWLFSWTGLVLLILGNYIFGIIGINLTYHRLVAHRSFKCPRWLECTLAILGACSLQFSPAHWAAVHRRHHHHTDDDLDPHSPIASFFWAHMVWLVVRREDMKRRPLLERYAKDLMRDPFYAWLERRNNWARIGLGCWIAFFVVGFAAAWLSGSSAGVSTQFGLSLLVWGGALRTVLVWHSTWAVNSASHIWGYRNYETADRSRNNIFVSLLMGGEWHNNHHADPAAARQGRKWWEFDLAWLTIRCFMRLGLVTDVILQAPNPGVTGNLSPPEVRAVGIGGSSH